ncbi:hypothetical protein [Asticcacaulis sp. AND118]|uniref:hypothetical protein n=1 Tax=Asticcacaulis sp. AND118 TaxID=2840468 RepID=UPI001CFFB773|nr:hypothetical protein [Asticcacaulis sp. AND118]UDF03872.1 hypothetical protein LH365_02160 [Asticcacaulis sp. AND118]
MAHPLEKLVQDRKGALSVALDDLRAQQQKIAVLQAEIAAYEEALKYVGVSEPIKKPRVRQSTASAPKGHWDAVFGRLCASHLNEISYEHILSAAKQEGVEVKDASVRATMMKYVDEGIFERVKNGVFRFTSKGRSTYGITLPPPIIANAHTHQVTGTDDLEGLLS